MMSKQPDLLVILGPTASGKTTLGVELARRLDGEILSADSRQVFRGMDLGTGKDLEEYGEVPYHLIDLQDAGTEFSVFDFQQTCYKGIVDIRLRSRFPLLVGGTALYLQSVLQDYCLVPVAENPELRAELAPLPLEELQQRLLRLKPAQHNSTDLKLRERLVRAIEIAEGERQLPPPPPAPPIHPLVLGIHFDPETLRQRIRLRLQQRIDAGMIDEARRLKSQGVSGARLDYYGLEYRFLNRYLKGELSLEEMTTQLSHSIARFAKQQRSWFRRMEREGIRIDWLDGNNPLVDQAWAVLQRAGFTSKR